jgi:multidrug efflux pump subunit AcrA (membrane-fusion protein)
LRRGLQGTASPVGFPELELPASVQQISSFPVGTNVFDGQLSVELGNDARAVVPGMSCQVTLVAYDKADALTVPAKAVFEDPQTGTRNTVYVKRGDGKPQPRKVSIGQKTDEKWEVLQGLAAGDEILLEKPE